MSDLLRTVVSQCTGRGLWSARAPGLLILIVRDRLGFAWSVSAHISKTVRRCGGARTLEQAERAALNAAASVLGMSLGEVEKLIEEVNALIALARDSPRFGLVADAARVSRGRLV